MANKKITSKLQSKEASQLIPSSPADHVDLTAKCHTKLDSHMAQPSQPHHPNLETSLVQAMVLVWGVGGDSSTQQRRHTSQGQVGGNGVGVPAAASTQAQTHSQAITAGQSCSCHAWQMLCASAVAAWPTPCNAISTGSHRCIGNRCAMGSQDDSEQKNKRRHSQMEIQTNPRIALPITRHVD